MDPNCRIVASNFKQQNEKVCVMNLPTFMRPGDRCILMDVVEGAGVFKFGKEMMMTVKYIMPSKARSTASSSLK